DLEADALIEDIDPHLAIVAREGCDENSILTRMPPGVRDEVRERLFREVAVDECRQPIGAFDLDVACRAGPFGGVLEQRTKLNDVRARRLLARLRACEDEQRTRDSR